MEPAPVLPADASPDVADLSGPRRPLWRAFGGTGSRACTCLTKRLSSRAWKTAPAQKQNSVAQTPASSDMVALPSAESEIRRDPELATAAGATIDSASAAGVAFARERAPDMEITLRATGVSWVEIIRNDGEEVMTRLMRAGETYLVDSRDRLYLSTGNAGGLELVFDDGTVRPIGESGEILRDLLLDAVKLRNQL